MRRFRQTPKIRTLYTGFAIHERSLTNDVYNNVLMYMCRLEDKTTRWGPEPYKNQRLGLRLMLTPQDSVGVGVEPYQHCLQGLH